MPRNDAKRQKHLQKQKAKRKEKRTLIAKRSSPDPTVQFAGAEDWPIVEALEGESLWRDGMGYLVLSRRMPNGRLAWASFLVDVWCLGVKDAVIEASSHSEYKD